MSDSEPEFSVPSLSSQEVADSSSESDEEAPAVVKKSRGPALKYTQIKSFEKKEEFEHWWNTEKTKWNLAKSYSQKNEEVDRWLCHYSIMKGYSCNVCLKADATSSVNWHNWPLLVLGHSDLNRHCITTLLAVGKSEDTYVYSGVFRALKDRGYNPDSVLGDGAGAITAATKQHFPRALRLMCFRHLIRRVDVHKKGIPEELQSAFRSDICMLQYSRNEKEFQRLSELMVTAWMDAAHPSVAVFATYFTDTWLHSDLNRWSEGESSSCLNNNGIESVNLRIKSDHTVRKMQNFNVFMEKVTKLLNYWAVNLRPVPTKPDIPLKVLKAAYELQKQCESGKRLFIKLRSPTKYVIASAKSSFANNEQLHAAYKASFHTGPRTWEEYLELRFVVHVVESSPLGPFFTCSCPEGSKKEPCKHAAMVMCSLEKTCEYPLQVTAKEMQANRKRKNTAGRDPLAPTQNRYAAL